MPNYIKQLEEDKAALLTALRIAEQSQTALMALVSSTKFHNGDPLDGLIRTDDVWQFANEARRAMNDTLVNFPQPILPPVFDEPESISDHFGDAMQRLLLNHPNCIIRSPKLGTLGYERYTLYIDTVSQGSTTSYDEDFFRKDIERYYSEERRKHGEKALRRQGARQARQ